MDYSHNGLLATIRHMKERNVRFAGVGRNLADAAAPVYLECREARVALIAATSSFHETWAAAVTFDLEEVIAEAQEAADKLVPAAEPVFWEINGVNAGYMREGKL